MSFVGRGGTCAAPTSIRRDRSEFGGIFRILQEAHVAPLEGGTLLGPLMVNICHIR